MNSIPPPIVFIGIAMLGLLMVGLALRGSRPVKLDKTISTWARYAYVETVPGCEHGTIIMKIGETKVIRMRGEKEDGTPGNLEDPLWSGGSFVVSIASGQDPFHKVITAGKKPGTVVLTCYAQSYTLDLIPVGLMCRTLIIVD